MKIMHITKSFNAADSRPQTTTQQFKAGADPKEGVSGRLGIDTSYENDEAATQRGMFY